MTPEKAIKFFDEEIVRLEGAPIINGCEMTDDWRGHLEMCKLAKAALEKQIPKKPTESGKYDFCCPCCNTQLNVNKEDIYIYDIPAPPHCEKCGQALDWSDAE